MGINGVIMSYNMLRLTDYARGLYGDKDYTIKDGILTGKGRLVYENSWQTNWKNAYYYKEGIFVMRVNGNQARTFAKNNNITIEKI